LFEVTDWLQWEPLKDSIATAFGQLFDQFKKDFEVWMKWHTMCANSKYAWTDELMRGVAFEG
jgi:hypothetical protein